MYQFLLEKKYNEKKNILIIPELIQNRFKSYRNREKRRRFRTYNALDSLISMISYYDFFSYDAFILCLSSILKTSLNEKNIVTSKFLFDSFFNNKEIEEIEEIEETEETEETKKILKNKEQYLKTLLETSEITKKNFSNLNFTEDKKENINLILATWEKISLIQNKKNSETETKNTKENSCNFNENKKKNIENMKLTLDKWEKSGLIQSKEKYSENVIQDNHEENKKKDYEDFLENVKKNYEKVEEYISKYFNYMSINTENTPLESKIQFSQELNISFIKSTLNALYKFKTPIITPEILFITLMDCKEITIGKIINIIINNEKVSYNIRYHLLKKIYRESKYLCKRINKNQRKIFYFYYLLKSQISESEFYRLLKKSILNITRFRNILIKIVLKINFSKFLREKIQYD